MVKRVVSVVGSLLAVVAMSLALGAATASASSPSSAPTISSPASGPASSPASSAEVAMVRPAPAAAAPVCPGRIENPRLAGAGGPATVEGRFKASCKSGEKADVKACVQVQNGKAWRSTGSKSCATQSISGGKTANVRATMPASCGTKKYRTKGLFTVAGKTYTVYSKTISLKGKAC